MIVVLRPVQQVDTHTYRVPSEDGLRHYVVSNGACECSDYLRHGAAGFYCKHKLAVGLLARLNGQGKGNGKANGQR